MRSPHCLKVSVCWRDLKTPSPPYAPAAAQLCSTWSSGRAEGGLEVTGRGVSFRLPQEGQPPTPVLYGCHQGQLIPLLPPWIVPLSFCCWLCPKGSSQGAGREPPSLSLVPAQGGDSGCIAQNEASSCLQPTVCVMPAYIYIYVCLCLYVAFCLCFAVMLSLGLFGTHPGMRSHLGCPGLLLSVARTKGSFQ